MPNCFRFMTCFMMLCWGEIHFRFSSEWYLIVHLFLLNMAVCCLVSMVSPVGLLPRCVQKTPHTCLVNQEKTPGGCLPRCYWHSKYSKASWDTNTNYKQDTPFIFHFKRTSFEVYVLVLLVLLRLSGQLDPYNFH